MIKHNLTRNIGKLEKWIESYGNEGYVLTKISGMGSKFDFQKATSDGFIPKVRIDYHTFLHTSDYQNYIAMFEDSGWRHIYGSKNSGYQYFQQGSPNISDDIFSDCTSKAELYKRIAHYWFSLFCCYLPLLVVFQNNDSMKLSNLIHMKNMYYTPGLWERTGANFWSGFLFETPFAVGRAFGGWLFVILTLGFLVAAVRAMYWYYKERSSN